MTKLIECVIVGGDQDGLTFELRADWPPATVLVPLGPTIAPGTRFTMQPAISPVFSGPPLVLPRRRYWMQLTDENRPSVDREGRVRYAVP